MNGNDIRNFQGVLIVYGQVLQLRLGSHCPGVVFHFLAGLAWESCLTSVRFNFPNYKTEILRSQKHLLCREVG